MSKVKICHSADQNKGEPSTIYEQLSKALRKAEFKCAIELGERNRVNGKLNMHEFLRWRPKDSVAKVYGGDFDKEYADKIYRLYGQTAYVEYVKLFEAEKEEKNLPKLQIFTTCPLLIDTIPACVYADSPEEGKKAEDVKEFDGDDPYDCSRILLTGIREYQVQNAKQFEHDAKTQEAINELAKGDQTSFYRKMEYLESKKSGAQSSISFRRRGFQRHRFH